MIASVGGLVAAMSGPCGSSGGGLNHSGIGADSFTLEEDKEQEIRAAKRGPKLSNNFRLKICDLGNGCWTYHHFSTQI